MADKYATFDEGGTLIHRLIRGVHPIPADATPVDEDLWLRLTQETLCVWKIDEKGSITKHPLPPPSDQELEVAVKAHRDNLLAEASTRVAPLQDAIDLGVALENEQAELIKWKEYRVALIRVEQQLGFPKEIQWPQAPGQTEPV